MRAVLPVSVKIGDRSHGQVFGGVCDGFADGLGHGETAALAAAAGLAQSPALRFGFDYDAGHHGDRFARIFAARSFSRKHDRIGAIENGIGNVAGFGARGPRVLDHGFQHLRSGNDGLAPCAGAADYVLLDHGNFFRRHLDAEIPARDHDSVRDFQDFLQMIDGLGLFQFGDDRHITSVALR